MKNTRRGVWEHASLRSQKARCREALAQCRRRDSNPRHADMIPARFGLTIANSGPVGHAVGHNRSFGRTPIRVSLRPREQGSDYSRSKPSIAGLHGQPEGPHTSGRPLAAASRSDRGSGSGAARATRRRAATPRSRPTGRGTPREAACVVSASRTGAGAICVTSWRKIEDAVILFGHAAWHDEANAATEATADVTASPVSKRTAAVPAVTRPRPVPRGTDPWPGTVPAPVRSRSQLAGSASGRNRHHGRGARQRFACGSRWMVAAV